MGSTGWARSYRFRTTLVTDGTIRRRRLDGDLWLVGGGDPVLDTDALDAMVRDLAESGIRRDHGHVPDRHGCASRHLPDRSRAIALCGLQPVRSRR
jgi:D-alanyl-D-alanine carboxypeptidase